MGEKCGHWPQLEFQVLLNYALYHLRWKYLCKYNLSSVLMVAEVQEMICGSILNKAKEGLERWLRGCDHQLLLSKAWV